MSVDVAAKLQRTSETSQFSVSRRRFGQSWSIPTLKSRAEVSGSSNSLRWFPCVLKNAPNGIFVEDFKYQRDGNLSNVQYYEEDEKLKAYRIELNTFKKDGCACLIHNSSTFRSKSELSLDQLQTNIVWDAQVSLRSSTRLLNRAADAPLSRMSMTGR